MIEQSEAVEKNESAKKGGGLFAEVIRFALIAVLVVLPIRLFVAQPFIVSGSSMDPTFLNGDYLIVDELTYKFEKPSRGDVIVFRFPEDTTKFFIKRVIGLPGETVSISGSAITIINKEHPEGFVLDEKYISAPSQNRLRVTLDNHDYFVMGDNRPASSDSRIWGPLPENLIVGRALLRLLPAGKVGIFPGAQQYDATSSPAN